MVCPGAPERKRPKLRLYHMDQRAANLFISMAIEGGSPTVVAQILAAWLQSQIPQQWNAIVEQVKLVLEEHFQYDDGFNEMQNMLLKKLYDSALETEADEARATLSVHVRKALFVS